MRTRKCAECGGEITVLGKRENDATYYCYHCRSCRRRSEMAKGRMERKTRIERVVEFKHEGRIESAIYERVAGGFQVRAFCDENLYTVLFTGMQDGTMGVTIVSNTVDCYLKTFTTHQKREPAVILRTAVRQSNLEIPKGLADVISEKAEAFIHGQLHVISGYKYTPEMRKLMDKASRGPANG